MLHVPDWFSCLLQHRPEVLLAGYNVEDEDLRHHLRAFWESYRQENPSHPVFATHCDHLDSCLPYFLFGDEGRGHRKSPVMIFAFETVLGLRTKAIYEESRKTDLRGAAQTKALLDAQRHTAKLSSLKSRFLLAVLPHLWYKGKLVHVYRNTLDAVSVKCQDLFHAGVQHCGKKFYGVLLGVKGDSPALTKMGMLNRAFNRLGFDKGICPFCLGGKQNFPWEDMSQEAAWHSTIGQVRPWDANCTNQLLSIPFSLDVPEFVFRSDPFHVCKYGIGRHFGASALVLLASWNTWGAAALNFDERMARAFDDFSFCCSKELKGTPHCKAFTRDGLHFDRESSFPWAGWKGSDTMLVLRWLVRLIRYGIVTDARSGTSLLAEPPGPQELLQFQKDVLEAVLDGACSMVRFFQILYHNGAWILSPACFLAESSEDFIGQVARLARRTSARSTCSRTIQRYLIKCHFDYKDLTR
ncbi:unnamed protein product [Symbiodinium sp. CCMP2456]|nr:unnamed protein product [Symbiodinium sp. CCMP2456]